jgi:glutamate racemase
MTSIAQADRAAQARSRPIVIFDSGVGGLPYLDTARSALSLESFVYVADRKGFPYGSKSHDEVRDIVVQLVASLVEAYAPKAIVIACNTASQAALSAVREANPGLAIVGTVPAVKPAAERSRSRVIGVMATAGAVRDPYLDELVARHASGVRVLREACQSLVSFVERRSIDASAEERREAIAPFVGPLVAAGADEIVLACTHYLHLREDIASFAGEGVEVVDSRQGVVKRLKQVLTDCGLLCAAAPRAIGSAPEFLLTGDAPPEPIYGRFAAAFGLSEPRSFSGRAEA